MTEYTKGSKWAVTAENGTHVGDIIRQQGRTLWSLHRRGMDRPFKRNIPSLEAAKKLADEHPQIWAGRNFNLRHGVAHIAMWMAILAGVLLAVKSAIG